MILSLIGFLVLILAIGAVSLTLSEPLERPFSREFVNYGVVVGGSILGFTAVIGLLSAIFI